MKSGSTALRRRWAIIALRVALPFATFAAGWYFAPKAADGDSATQAKAAAVHNYRNSAPPSASALAQAKAELAAILKIPDEIERKRKLYEFAASLDTGTLKAVLAGLTSEPANSLDRQAWSYLTDRWAELDPKAAVAWAQNLRNPQDKNSSITEIFDVWSAQNPAAALAAISQLPASIRRNAERATMENFAKADPQGALAAVRNLPLDQLTGYYYQMIFSSLATTNPTDALASALSQPSNLRNVALAGVAQAWAQQDHSAALAWANSLPAGSDKDGIVRGILGTMSQQDPAAAASLAANLSAGGNAMTMSDGTNIYFRDNRELLLESIASNWATQDPAAVLNWADQTLTGAAYNSVTEAALRQMRLTDPAAAAAALAQISDPSVLNQTIPNLATTWAKQDMQAALTWAQSLPTTNDNVRQTALNNALSTWTDPDPAAATAYLQQNLSTDPDFGQLAAKLATSWGNTDPQAALTWAQNLPVGTAQDTALVAAVTQLANVDPQTAWADAEQLTGSSQSQAIGNVISAMADQDPDEAAAALDNLPAGADLDAATTNVAKSWLAQDPDEATQWIDTLPQGAARDGAVSQLVSTVGKTDPATAFDWATSISDPITRNTQVVKLMRQWSHQNPDAAATATQNALGNLTGLSISQQNTLQKIAAKEQIP